MMKWFKREKIVIRDEVAQSLCDILFPQPIEKTEEGFTYLSDSSVDLNLHAALIDLEEGNNDEVTRNTIKSILLKLEEARTLLYANYKLKEKASYLVVDSPSIPIEDRVKLDR